MAIRLQIADLAAALRHPAPSNASGTGMETAPLLTHLFNETLAALLGPDPQLIRQPVTDEEPTLESWQRALVDQTYQQVIGPRLTRQQALLHHLTDQFLTFWDGIQELCQWLAGELIKLHAAGGEELVTGAWRQITAPLAVELHRPGWRDRVQLTGRTAGLWQSPVDQRWLILELQTGSSARETGAGIAALYQLILQAAGECSPGQESPLVRRVFSPLGHEERFSPAALLEAREEVVQLAGRLAGVVTESTPTRTPRVKVETAPLPLQTADPVLEERGAQLLATLAEFGHGGRIDGPPLAGPSILRFTVSTGERFGRQTLERIGKELQLRLGLKVPPRLLVEGSRLEVELPRPERQVVHFSSIRDQIPPGDPRTGAALVPLGIDITGRLQLLDFSRPEDAHLLVAGSRGSGKSEWLRSAIAGLQQANSPETLRLILIDGPRQIFAALDDSPFLQRRRAFPERESMVTLFSTLADEMDHRRGLFAAAGVESRSEYVERTGRQLPRIFAIGGEYADLITTDHLTRRAIEWQIARLGQLARATGIHLIFATAHPGREIMRGALDAHIPARIALRLEKPIESKMVINQPGAERLLGRGDLLFRDIGAPIRLQGVLLDSAT